MQQCSYVFIYNKHMIYYRKKNKVVYAVPIALA